MTSHITFSILHICENKLSKTELPQSLITTILFVLTLWAATTHPVCRSELKYSKVYPIKCPVFVNGESHATVRLDWDMFKTRGMDGDPGNVAGSGLLCRWDPGCFSTVKAADHEVSPLSEEAVQV